MRRIVLLPAELDVKLDDLAAIEDETNGILLYRRQGGDNEKYCPLVAIYMTAKGTSGHVQAKPQRIEVVNEFFQRHPDFHHVKFHTHSRGTIRRFGEYLAVHFSGGDINSYKEQLVHDPSFIGMLVTPRVKLLHAPDNPVLRVVDSYPEDLGMQISEEMGAIAQEKGFDLLLLQAKEENNPKYPAR